MLDGPWRFEIGSLNALVLDRWEASPERADATATPDDADPEGCFLALPGVGAKTARRAAESWRGRRGLRELHLLLAEHGLARLVTRLDKHYGGPGSAEATIRADPYRLTELHGVGFITADKIASSVGVDPASPRRAHAAIVHLLREAEGDGHSFLPWSGTGSSRSASLPSFARVGA